jgi:hypothetical protein
MPAAIVGMLLAVTTGRAMRPRRPVGGCQSAGDQTAAAIWSTKPATRERLPQPDRVYRCDELEELKSYAVDVAVHEAWIDTGSRPSSKLRWIEADVGDRGATPSGHPRPLVRLDADHEPLDSGLLAELGWRSSSLRNDLGPLGS